MYNVYTICYLRGVCQAKSPLHNSVVALDFKKGGDPCNKILQLARTTLQIAFSLHRNIKQRGLQNSAMITQRATLVPSEHGAQPAGWFLSGFPPVTWSGAESPWPCDWSIRRVILHLLPPAGRSFSDVHPGLKKKKKRVMAGQCALVETS